MEREWDGEWVKKRVDEEEQVRSMIGRLVRKLVR